MWHRGVIQTNHMLLGRTAWAPSSASLWVHPQQTNRQGEGRLTAVDHRGKTKTINSNWELHGPLSCGLFVLRPPSENYPPPPPPLHLSSSFTAGAASDGERPGHPEWIKEQNLCRLVEGCWEVQRRLIHITTATLSNGISASGLQPNPYCIRPQLKCHGSSNGAWRATKFSHTHLNCN